MTEGTNNDLGIASAHTPARVVVVYDTPREATICGPETLHSLDTFQVRITFKESATDFNKDDVIVCNGSVNNVSGSYPVYTATIVPNGKGDVDVGISSAGIRHLRQCLLIKLETYREAKRAQKNAEEQLKKLPPAEMRKKKDASDGALNEFCCQYGGLNNYLREYAKKVVQSFASDSGMRSIELVTDHGNAVDLENGVEALSALRRIRSFSLENKVNTLFDHASVARAAEERETVKYQQVSDEMFHRLREHARHHVGDVKRDSQCFEKHVRQFTPLKKIIEDQDFREVWEEGKKLLQVESRVRDPECDLTKINLEFKEISCFFDGAEKQLSELMNRFCGRWMCEAYQGLTSIVAKDFDRSWLGRYQWTGPVALSITATTAAVLIFWPSPFLLSWGTGILSATFVLSLIGSAWAGHQKRNSIMKRIRSELNRVLLSIFPAKQSAMDGDRRFIFPRSKQPFGSSQEDWEKGLQDGNVKLSVDGFINKIHKTSRRRMRHFNFYLLILPAIFLFISCFDQSHEQYHFYGIDGDGQFSKLAQGKIVHTNDDWIYVDKADSWLPNALLREAVFHVSQTEIAGGPRELSLKVGMQEKTERFIDKLLAKQKQTPQTLIINPTMGISNKGWITEEHTQKIVEAIKGLHLSPDRFNDLTAAVKDIAAAGRQTKNVQPVVIQIPDNRPSGHAPFTIVFVDGKQLDKFERRNALLMAVFDREVTGIGLKKHGKDWVPFRNDDGDQKADGIGTPDEAFLFGLVSLHPYTPNGTARYSPPLDYLRHVSEFIGRCAVNGPVKLSIEGFASDRWQDPRDDIANGRQYTIGDMNAALAEGRRLAAIAQILKLLGYKIVPGDQSGNIEFAHPLDNYAETLVNVLIAAGDFQEATDRLKSEAKLGSFSRKFTGSNEMQNSRNDWVDNRSELMELMGRSFVIRFLNATKLKCGY